MKEELEHFSEHNIISKQTQEDLLKQYLIKESNFSFIKIILTIGALLVGLGILSFIAANWQELGKFTKVGIIVGIYLVTNFTGYKLANLYPKTSISLIYLGVLTYGAGIFLIGQIFHFSGHFSSAFLLWAVGILPMAALWKEKFIFVFAHILFLIYINGSIEINNLPFLMLLIAPSLYYLNNYMENFKPGTFFNNLVGLNTIGYFMTWYGLQDFLIYLIFFLIGLFMYLKPLGLNKDIVKLQGILVVGISGLIFTFKDVWNIVPIEMRGTFSIIFAICYLIFMLYLVKRKSIISLIFICITILRYYFDTFYDFMPKSLFFVIGGLLLLGFGYYFEKLRKRGLK